MSNTPDWAPSKAWWAREGIGKNVYEAAVERAMYVLETFEDYYVSFSGGKDSTATLNVVLDAREALGMTEPMKVVYFDEEIVDPATEEYVYRCIEKLPIDLRWYCIPVKQRNACSASSPDWYPWGDEVRHLWVKDIPAGATNVAANTPWYPSHEIDERRTLATLGPYFFRDWQGDAYGTKTCAVFLGIRAAESMMRRRIFASQKGNWDHWLNPFTNAKWCAKAYPVFDWTDDDIWVAVRKFGWDYSQVYDQFEAMMLSNIHQRIGTPFGEEPSRSLYQWQILAPDLWDKMLDRVPGARTAALYSRTALYGKAFGGASGGTKTSDVMPALQPGQTYRDLVRQAVMAYEDPAMRTTMAKKAQRLIRRHQNSTREPILPHTEHPRTGLSWQSLIRIIVLGDVKMRHELMMVPGAAKTARLREEYDAELDRMRMEGTLDLIK